MFGLFKKGKKEKVQTIKGFYSMIDGKSIDLSEVNDEMFSNRVLGDGIAVEPTSNVVVSPCNGKITLITDTKHAIGIENEDGVQVLIHIGLDTVKLNGQGFECLCKVDDEVKVGEPLINIDRELIKKENFSDVTMMILVEQNEYKLSACHTNKLVKSGESLLIEYE